MRSSLYGIIWSRLYEIHNHVCYCKQFKASRTLLLFRVGIQDSYIMLNQLSVNLLSKKKNCLANQQIFQVENCGVAPHCLHRHSVTLISVTQYTNWEYQGIFPREVFLGLGVLGYFGLKNKKNFYLKFIKVLNYNTYSYIIFCVNMS